MITSPPHLVELRPGTKPGFIEVIFPWKPAKDETVSLRRAGFRFTTSSGPARWYGKAENAPEGLRAGVQALQSLRDGTFARTITREPGAGLDARGPYPDHGRAGLSEMYEARPPFWHSCAPSDPGCMAYSHHGAGWYIERNGQTFGPFEHETEADRFEVQS